jgi:protein transport protein HofC
MPDAEDPPVLIPIESVPRRGRFLLRHLLYAVLYCALFCWLAVITGLLLFSGLLGLMVAIVSAVAVIYGRRRSTQQDALLWALAVAAERGMPLGATLDAFAGQCRGGYRRKVLAAAQHLKLGASLPEAASREPGLFPRDAETLIRVGSETGMLPSALREASTLRAGTRRPWGDLALRIAYLVWVIIVLEGIVSFISYFILPKFEAIFADFGMSLPSITIITIEATHFLIKFWPVLVLIVLAQAGLLLLATVSSLGLLPWDLPLVNRLFRSRHSALICRCLARVVEGNRPITQGLATLARIYPVSPIRARLRCAADDVTRGEHWCEAMARHGLIGPADAVLLESAQRLGNLPWALRVSAENIERRLTFRLQLVVQWLLPLLVLAIGAVVFVVAVSYFAPVVSLIQRLT